MARDIHAYVVDETKVLAGINLHRTTPEWIDAEVEALKKMPELEDADPKHIDVLLRGLLGENDEWIFCERTEFEAAMTALCVRHASKHWFTNAPWSFESDIDELLGEAGLELTYEDLLNTDVEPSNGEGDYVITAHSAKEVAEITARLKGLDFGDHGDFETVAGYFEEAAKAGRALVLFIH
jgi:hypothetical protein